MKRDVLANRHQFGEAAAPLEQEIESFVPEMETYETLKQKVTIIKHTNILKL